MGEQSTAPDRPVRIPARVRELGVSLVKPATAALLAAALAGCSGGAEADPEGWATAIEQVSGVTSADVGYSRQGPGNLARVVVSTDTNDAQELERITRETLVSFVDATQEMDTFSIIYSVRTGDGTRALDPEGIGWSSMSIEFLRDDVAAGVGADADG